MAGLGGLLNVLLKAGRDLSEIGEEGSPPNLIEQTRELFDNGDYAGTIRSATQAIERYPVSDYLFLLRGLAKGSLKDSRGAVVDFSRAIELNPKLASAYSGRSAILRGQGKNAKALVDIDKAILLDPTAAWFFFERGLLFGCQNRHDEAIKDFSHAIDLDPTMDYAFVQRGLSYIIQGEKERAYQDFSRAGELGHPDAYELIDKFINQDT